MEHRIITTCLFQFETHSPVERGLLYNTPKLTGSCRALVIFSCGSLRTYTSQGANPTCYENTATGTSNSSALA